MSELGIFRVDASEFTAAVRALQRITGAEMSAVWRGEVQTVVRRLLRFEYRAQPTKVRTDLMDRLVIVWDSGGVLNIDKANKDDWVRAPRGASRQYRARRGGKLIPAKGPEVAAYVRRVGYLASGWGVAAQQAGIATIPQFVLRHRLGVNGLAIPGFDHVDGPRFYMANFANPRDGSRAKLETTLRIQSQAIQRSIAAGVDRAFARVRPSPALAAAA